jgi:hypothetical protein
MIRVAISLKRGSVVVSLLGLEAFRIEMIVKGVACQMPSRKTMLMQFSQSGVKSQKYTFVHFSR